MPKIKGKYLISRGGAFPDEHFKKFQILGLFRDGLFRGGVGAVPVFCYCSLKLIFDEKGSWGRGRLGQIVF